MLRCQISAALLLGAASAAGCRSDAPAPPANAPAVADMPAAVAAPALATRADSLAWGAYRAVGGPDVWDRVPFVRFDFAPGQTGQPPSSRRRHLWERRTGRYRLEARRGDSLFVVLFNTATRAGEVYQTPDTANAAALAPVPEPQHQAWLDRAYRSFVNDTYWLLQPAKLFDPGVTRAFEPDSSNAARQVVRLSFDQVGLTPGDRYWLYFAPEDAGLYGAWRFHLQGEAAPGPRIVSDTPVTLETPHGRATVRTRHRVGEARYVLTDRVALPAEVDARHFTDPRALLRD